MMNNKIIIGIIVVIVAVMGVIFLTGRAGNNNSLITQNAGKYCGPNGILTDTMPIQSHRSYCLKSNSQGKTYLVNTPNEYLFSIIDDQGNILKDLETTHTKKMHIIVARKDLAHFQHIHPNFNETTGQFSFSDVNFPADGIYRIFADFAPMGGQKDPSGLPLPVTLFEDVPVGIGSNYTPMALGSENWRKEFNGFITTLSAVPSLISGREQELALTILKDGKPVTDLQEYLGALGHSVILREGTLDFIHAHPVQKVTDLQTGNISFMVTFPEAGKYKIFTQFQRSEKVFTTDFVVSVTQGSGLEPVNNPMH